MADSYLLRIEGVNLSSFVFDTRDLSTIRGASLMLLDATDAAIAAVKSSGASVVVRSRGASSGLIEFSGAEPAAITSAVGTQLARQFPHATFVVDVVAQTAHFRKDIETLLAANRWRQLQQTSLAIPKSPARPAIPAACVLDGLRPASSIYPAPSANGFISEAAHARREYGRRAKTTFYATIRDRVRARRGLANNSVWPSDFAGDFGGIAVKKSSPLNGKLAAFYADGNGFGATQAEYCTTPALQQQFDEFVRTSREDFLFDFISSEGAKGEWRDEDLNAMRFETLLWGGDEMLFVMPASLGWRFATLFFDRMDNLNLKNVGDPTESRLPEKRLTHAAGLVFFQHHAPIDRIRRLVQDEMVPFAKGYSRDENSLTAVALESFDHLGTSYATAMRRRYRSTELHKMMIVGAELSAKLRAISREIDQLRNSSSFARSQLRRLVSEVVENSTWRNFTATWEPEPILPRPLRNASPQDKSSIAKLHDVFTDDAVLWLQLEELWDYARL